MQEGIGQTGSDSDREEMEAELLEVESISFQYRRAVSNYNCPSAARTPQNTYDAEEGIHCSRVVLVRRRSCLS